MYARGTRLFFNRRRHAVSRGRPSSIFRNTDHLKNSSISYLPGRGPRTGARSGVDPLMCVCGFSRETTDGTETLSGLCEELSAIAAAGVGSLYWRSVRRTGSAPGAAGGGGGVGKTEKCNRCTGTTLESASRGEGWRVESSHGTAQREKYFCGSKRLWRTARFATLTRQIHAD